MACDCCLQCYKEGKEAQQQEIDKLTDMLMRLSNVMRLIEHSYGDMDVDKDIQH